MAYVTFLGPTLLRPFYGDPIGRAGPHFDGLSRKPNSNRLGGPKNSLPGAKGSPCTEQVGCPPTAGMK